MTNFNNYESVEAYVIDLLIDQLDTYQNTKVHACDLAITLLETYNVDGCILIFNSDSQDWINHFRDELGVYWDELISNGYINHTHTNFFDSPGRLMYCLCEEIARQLVSQIDFINKAWNNKILLTKDVIIFLTKELENQI